MKIIYIRKLRYKDAEEKLERELHQAFLAGINFVQIVHGVGSGKLKELVENTIDRVDFAKIIRDGSVLENPGTTHIELYPPDRRTLKSIKY